MNKYLKYKVLKIKKPGKAIRNRLTKKNFKLLTFSNNNKDHNFVNFLKTKRLHFFLLKYRQLLQKLLGNIKLKKLKKLYKNLTIKKNKLYLSNFISNLELRLNTILYHTYLTPTININKHLILNNQIHLNKKKTIGINFITKPEDIIGLNKSVLSVKNKNSALMVNRKLKRLQFVKFYNIRTLKSNTLYLKKKNILNYGYFYKKKIALCLYKNKNHNLLTTLILYKSLIVKKRLVSFIVDKNSIKKIICSYLLYNNYKALSNLLPTLCIFNKINNL